MKQQSCQIQHTKGEIQHVSVPKGMIVLLKPTKAKTQSRCHMIPNLRELCHLHQLLTLVREYTNLKVPICSFQLGDVKRIKTLGKLKKQVGEYTKRGCLFSLGEECCLFVLHCPTLLRKLENLFQWSFRFWMRHSLTHYHCCTEWHWALHILMINFCSICIGCNKKNKAGLKGNRVSSTSDSTWGSSLRFLPD